MIGVYDSGFGGLFILDELLKKIPEKQFLYFGDNINAPYGNKNSKELFELSFKAVKLLNGCGCKLIIVACNTLSAGTVRLLQQNKEIRKLNIKILGIGVPSFEYIKKLNNTKKILILGTTQTVTNGFYNNEIKKYNPNLKINYLDAQYLVDWVEQGKYYVKQFNKLINNINKINPDFLLLGCTHFYYFKKQFKSLLNKKIQILNIPSIVAHKTVKYLKTHPELNIPNGVQVDVYTSGDLEAIKQFIKKNINSNRKIRYFGFYQ